MGTVRADATSKLRILLVEPDPIDAAVLVQLMRFSYNAPHVVTAASFSAAADILQREPIDTIFCSVAERKIEGLRALIRAAKSRPVVALIAKAESAVQNRATEAGALHVLCKENLLASFVHRMVGAAEMYPDSTPAYARGPQCLTSMQMPPTATSRRA